MAEVTAGESLGDPESHPTVAAAPTVPAYRPSVVDQLVDAVRRSPWNPVVLYVALALLLVGAELAVLWVNGTFPQDYQFMHVMLPVYAMVVLPSSTTATPWPPGRSRTPGHCCGSMIRAIWICATA